MISNLPTAITAKPNSTSSMITTTSDSHNAVSHYKQQVYLPGHKILILISGQAAAKQSNTPAMKFPSSLSNTAIA